MTGPRFVHRNFAWLAPEHSDYEHSRVVVLPVPYDSTASGWVGSREGPAAIIDASGNMELYDIGIGCEPYLVGIHTLPEVAAHSGSPEAMAERLEGIVGELIDDGKFVVTLGGEHTVAVGAARAYARRTSGLSVLAFDAHADMRDEYLDSKYNHACTLRRISEIAPIAQVGLRSAEREEHVYIREQGLRFYSPREFRAMGPEAVAEQLSESVYVTFDLDAFDSSVVSALGTPEPGGLHWDEVSDMMETVARRRHIVGFDVTELAPSLGPRANAQLAAKLVYRLIGLAIRAPSKMPPRKRRQETSRSSASHESVSKDSVLAALRRFDREYPSSDSYDNWLNKGNYKYALRHSRKLYPPKLILSWITGANREDFNGGPQTNSVFERLGFQVIDKPPAKWADRRR